MAVNKSRYDYCFRTGANAEQRFKQLVEKSGLNCDASTQKENMIDKIDFFINNKGVDVKETNTYLQFGLK